MERPGVDRAAFDSPSIEALSEWFKRSAPVTVLTGAGCSTASGIPDYRDSDGQWKRSAPMQYREFVGSRAARQRYWARSAIGFQKLGRAAPNAAHRTLAELERAGWIRALLTQNVDGLHQAAGSQQVLELHGAIARVECMSCGQTIPRDLFQAELLALNPNVEAAGGRIAPDGDADIDGSFEDYVIPDCRCGGTFKPAVVFFGENVPKTRVDLAYRQLRAAGGLLVVGSSLMVFSGYRFAHHAAREGIPLAIVNQGKTRADPLAPLRVAGDCTRILPALAKQLVGIERER